MGQILREALLPLVIIKEREVYLFLMGSQRLSKFPSVTAYPGMALDCW